MRAATALATAITTATAMGAEIIRAMPTTGAASGPIVLHSAHHLLEIETGKAQTWIEKKAPHEAGL